MKNDRKLVIYLICVGIATVFWFLNALNKEYSVELSFPVRYTNLPNNKVLANTPPDHFTLKVNSYGFTILRHKLSMAFSPLVFNVNDFTDERMEDSEESRFTYNSRTFIPQISNQVSNELVITEIQPDTISFYFDQVVSRNVKVLPDITYDLKKQHHLNGEITTTPDSVLVSGPESILDTLQYVKTKSQHYKELDQETQRNVQLEEFDKLEIETKRVVLNIPIEEFTEKQLYVPISVVGLPDSLSVTLFPNQARVNFLVALSQFSEILPEDFVLNVSYLDIEQKKELLDLNLQLQPPHILSVSMYPEHVEYLIEKKDD